MPTRAVEHHTSPAVTAAEPEPPVVAAAGGPATAQTTGMASAIASGSSGLRERESDRCQYGYVNEQHPLEEAVTALPVGFAEGVAARKNVDQ